MVDVELLPQELHSSGQMDHFNDLKELVLKCPTVDFLDDSDELLSAKFQLVYAWGSQHALPACQARVRIIQHVLRIFLTDLKLRELMMNCEQKTARKGKISAGALQSECLSMSKHTERYGSLPSTRLIPGTSSCRHH